MLPGSSRPYLEKNFRFQHDDQSYTEAREMLKSCISKHLADAHKVLELFNPLSPLADGSLSAKVRVNLQSLERSSENLKEIREYLRMA